MDVLHECDNCPICMAPMGPYISQEDEIAVLPCQHCYHDNCLSEWIQTATSCPYCRCEFASVTIVHEVKGPSIRSYTVEPKIQEEPILEEEDDDDEYTQDEDFAGLPGRSVAACLVCGSQEREDILMLCEFCDDPYHSFCLGSEELPQDAFCCPICTTNGERIANLPEHATLRTVAGRRRRSRRTRQTRSARQSTNRQVQYETWRAAWERVASRAWSRLNAGLEYQIEAEPSLTRQQEDELRHWRTRVERRATPNTVSTDTQDLAPQAVIDPQTASLWAAFEQARNFSKSPGPVDLKASTGAEDRLVIDLSAPEASLSQPKQKRPRASVKRKASDALDTQQKQSRARSSSVSADHTVQTGFLSSLLKNIKDSGNDSRPLSYKSLKSQSSPHHKDRPPSPGNMSSSASSDYSQSRPQSPTLGTAPVRHYNKAELSRLVSSQLKPLYHVKLTKDEFTNINRTVTRRIFDDPLVLAQNEFEVKSRIEQEIRHELNEILVPWD